MSDRYLATLPISQLVDHPQNSKVFGTEVDKNLVDSIADIGITTPLVVAKMSQKSYRVISGHRRKLSAQALGIEEVSCVVRQDLTDPLDIDDAWAESNVQREMTNEQKARWFSIRKRVEELKAEKRQKSGQTLENKGSTDLVENFPQGKSRDVAAAEVGWSGKTAEAAEDVVQAIDQAEESGDTETATELRETLNNKSVNAAKRKVSKPKPVHKRELIDAVDKATGHVTRAVVKAAEKHGRGKPYKDILASVENIKATCKSWKV